jgi:hypothetical protein
MTGRHTLLVAVILVAHVAIHNTLKASDPSGAAASQDARSPQATPDPPVRPIPPAQTIINACGADLNKLFAEFGAPKYMVVARGDTNDDDDVLFEYGTFVLRIHEDKVTSCFFKSNWTGPIGEIRIGDSRENVEKVLGKPTSVLSKDGVITAYGYDLQSPKTTMYTNFNDAGAVRRVEIAARD